ncbi:prepilin-type N-terminal cleavage/methylation domain-containing protein [bacterium]|nr:prepilin-type N-terminal cleavage/methylation domain-containing protein [bacterium]
MAKLRSRKGFTLVEMMIVVLIIGILIAIALPNFLRARENARLRACVANMKEIQAAVEQWGMETKASGDTEVPTDLDAYSNWLKTTPTCPSGGTYTISGTLNDYTVSCSVHGDLDTAMAGL